MASELHFLQLASSFLQLRRESLNCTRSGPFRHPLLKLAGRLFGLALFLLLQGIASSVSIIIYSKRRDRNGRIGQLADAESDVRKLQVANARPDDAGRGLARLSRTSMNALGLAEGDVVEIVGRRSTPARAVLSYAEDEGLDILRLDGLQRANAGAGSGDFVEIRKAEAKPATRVVFAPAQKNLRLQGSSEALRRTFGM